MDVDGTTAPPVASPVRAAVHAAGYAAAGYTSMVHADGVHGAVVFNDYLMRLCIETKLGNSRPTPSSSITPSATRMP